MSDKLIKGLTIGLLLYCGYVMWTIHRGVLRSEREFADVRSSIKRYVEGEGP